MGVTGICCAILEPEVTARKELGVTEYLTVDEVSERIRVHPRTVKRWLAAGKLRGKLLGDRAGWRVPEAELRRFMEDDEREETPETTSSDDDKTEVAS